MSNIFPQLICDKVENWSISVSIVSDNERDDFDDNCDLRAGQRRSRAPMTPRSRSRGEVAKPRRRAATRTFSEFPRSVADSRRRVKAPPDKAKKKTTIIGVQSANFQPMSDRLVR